MDHDQMIAVIQAHKEGKRIECRAHLHDHAWLDAKNPEWNFGNFDYRVKREPREFWLVPSAHCGCGSLINGRDGWHAYCQDQEYKDQIHVREVID